jgi:hypothetical protein
MSVTRRRVYAPDDVVVARMPPGNGAVQSASVFFTYPTPDCRILLKWALLFYQETQSGLVVPFDATLNSTVTWRLALQTAERAPTGAYEPTSNLIGQGPTTTGAQAVPLVIDTVTPANNLDGVSFDIQGGQDAVVGAVLVSCVGYVAQKGVTAVIRARYNSTVDMCDDEWNDAKKLMTPQVAQQFLGT